VSESLVFEDMELLGGDDFKAVLDQMEMDRVVAALWGCPVALRGRLLRKLTKRDSHVIEQAIAATEHFSFAQVRDAQQQALDVMCRLSRAGQIAFDVPDDMVA